MGERGLVVANAVHDREVAVLVEALHAGHGVLQAEMIIELAHARRLDADARPGAIIGVVAVGHDGVEAVIAPRKLDHHQDAVVIAGL